MSTNLSANDVAELIDAIDVSDPEAAHGRLDALLLEIMPDVIQEAAARLVARADWWASA